MEIIGWIGSIAFTFCAVPQAYKSYKDGHSDGLSLYYLLLWLIGEIFTIAYIFAKGDVPIPLVANYVGNLFVLSIILKYKFYPRKKIFYYDIETEFSAQDIMKKDFAEKIIIHHTTPSPDNPKTGGIKTSVEITDNGEGAIPFRYGIGSKNRSER